MTVSFAYSPARGSDLTDTQLEELNTELLTELRRLSPGSTLGVRRNDVRTQAFDGSNLDLDRRVVLIHGTANTLAGSVASLGPIPAQVTLPIACGTIERGS